MVAITLMIRDKEDGDYGYEPVAKSRGFCCNFHMAHGQIEKDERRNITIAGPSTDAKAQIMHTKNGTASDAATSANGCLAAERLVE